MAGKVLVVDDDASVQRILQYTLKQEGYDVVVAADGPEAFRLWQQQQPTLILLDVTLPGLDGYEVATRIRAKEGKDGHVPIIMLTAEQDVQEKVRALRAGADDYLIKPFHPAELLARMRSLIARFSPSGSVVGKQVLGKVHAYYGAKGGVGATTIAVNTAIALRILGRKVCLVDGNLQFGDHRVFLDLSLESRGIVDAAAASTVDRDLLRTLVETHESGIDTLLAPPSPEKAEIVTPAHMHQILAVLSDMYDYVIVDIDKRLDDVNLMVLDVADTIFGVMTADLSCLKNIRIVLEMIGHLGYADDKLKLVLNRSTAFTGISMKSAESALKHPIEFQVQNEYRGAITALNTGAPFMAGKAEAPLARSVMDFAKAVDKMATAPKDRTALQRA